MSGNARFYRQGHATAADRGYSRSNGRIQPAGADERRRRSSPDIAHVHAGSETLRLSCRDSLTRTRTCRWRSCAAWLMPELSSRNHQLRSEAERRVMNFPRQGSAADILKKAMIDVHAALPAIADGRMRMILTVHDELLFEAPREAADEATAAVRRLMEAAVALKVPLTVDVGAGENWNEATA